MQVASEGFIVSVWCKWSISESIRLAPSKLRARCNTSFCFFLFFAVRKVWKNWNVAFIVWGFDHFTYSDTIFSHLCCITCILTLLLPWKRTWN